MDLSNLVFAVAYKDNKYRASSVQLDGGKAFREVFANSPYSVRIWQIKGCIDVRNTIIVPEDKKEEIEQLRQEIKAFLNRLGQEE